MKQQTVRILTSTLIVLIVGIALATAADIQESAWTHFAQRHDEDGDGIVTAEEFGRTDRRFQEMDADGSGSVDAEELAEIEARYGTPRTPPAPGSHLVRIADRDRNHELTRDEWDAMVSALDADADGTISPEEMIETMLRNRPAWPGRGPDDQRRRGDGAQRRGADRAAPLPGDRFDTNQDGLLDRHDLDEIFNDMDADGDAVIRSDEMPPPSFGRRHHGPGCGWAKGPGRWLEGPEAGSVQ